MCALKTYSIEISSKDRNNNILSTYCISVSSDTLAHNRCESILDMSLCDDCEVECISNQIKEQITEIIRKVLK